MGSQLSKEFGCDYIPEPSFDHMKAISNIIRTKNSINNDKTNTHKDNINNSNPMKRILKLSKVLDTLKTRFFNKLILK
jgi:hypothetical protein